MWPARYDTLPAALANLPQNIFVFAPDFQNPRVQQGSLGAERAITNDLSFGVNYQYVKGDDLPRTADINIASPTTATTPIYDTAGTTQIGTATYTKYTGKAFTNFNRVLEFQSNAHSKYNGLTFDLNKRFSSNWQARLAYTYAQAKDDRPDATIVVPGVDDAREAQDALNLGNEWAWADTDVRHRVVLSGVWNLDYFGGVKNQLIYGMLSGWTLSGILSYQSGQPYSPVISGDLNGDKNASNDRAPGAVRNSLRLPSQLSIDPRITRDIHIVSNYHVQLIAEAFNLTNRSNVRTLRNTQFSYNAATNRLTQASLNPVTGFQSPSAVVGPRTYQFAAKILF